MPANIKANSKFASVLFQIFIVVSLLSYWGFVTLIRPISSYYKDYDPEVPYFMNSLAVFKGEPYYYLDHPGTPVEIVGSAILGIFYIVRGTDSEAFIAAQLQNPEPFFFVTHLFITVGSIVCGLLLYRATLSISSQEKEDFLLATAISLMYFAIHPLAFSTLTLWSHMSFNFPFGSLILVLFWNSLKKKRHLSSLTLAVYAFAAGVLTATMIYFAAWVIGLVIFVRHRNEENNVPRTVKRILVIGVSSLLGFALAMLPALDRIEYYIVWTINLILHQGTYGSGEITTLHALWSNLLGLINTLPPLSFLMTTIFILLVFVAVINKNKQQGTTEISAMTISLAIQVVVLLLFCLKHPGSDSFVSRRYVLPVAATIPLLTLLVLQLIRPFSRLYLVTRFAVILLVFGGSPIISLIP